MLVYIILILMSKFKKNEISIIGGAGHIGFPLGLAFASKKKTVNLVDLNKKNLNLIKNGKPPFYEIGAKKLLLRCLKSKRLKFSTELSSIKSSKFVIICIGTPINKELKPLTKDFLIFFKNLFKFIQKDQIIVIRSSVYPGIIENLFKSYGHINKNITYCPERIVQSKALEELPKLPQIISGNTKLSIKEAGKLFKLICKEILVSTINEAELVKLFSNTNRYINFAIANQLYLICQKNNLSFKKIRHLMMKGYERNLNLPGPGLTAGPCLLKDTMQLSSFFKGKLDLGIASMKVNTKIVEIVLNKIKNIKGSKKKTIGILGIAFKAETDDTRDSLAFEIYKKLKRKNFKVIFSDEYYISKENVKLKNFIKKSNIIVIGALHKKYKKINFPSSKKIIDVWDFY